MPDEIQRRSPEFDNILKIIREQGKDFNDYVLEYLLSKILLLEKEIRDSQKVG